MKLSINQNKGSIGVALIVAIALVTLIMVLAYGGPKRPNSEIPYGTDKTV